MTDLIATLKSEMKAELCGNILPFWLNFAIDKVHGGFVGHIDFHNKITIDAPKGAIQNARILWTFSSAYRIVGDEDYLQAAHRAYNYITKYFIDREYSGVYWKLDYRGRPLDSKKQIYALAFTIYGLTEYYRITQDQEVLEIAKDLYHTIEKRSFDPKENGYFEAFGREWQVIDDLRLSAKDNNENKTLNTHLHILEAYTNLYRVWKDRGVEKALINLIQLFLDKFINDDFHLNLFFDDHWNNKSDLVSFGHDIESSWLLYEAAVVLENQELIDIINPLAIGIATNNFQGIADDGGLIYEFFPSENRKDKDKHWWPQAEAVIAYFNIYQITNDRHFLDAALRSWSFIKKQMIDTERGEWYWSVNHAGVPYENEEKAGFWKGPYHNGRACLEIVDRGGSKK